MFQLFNLSVICFFILLGCSSTQESAQLEEGDQESMSSNQSKSSCVNTTLILGNHPERKVCSSEILQLSDSQTSKLRKKK